MKTPVAVFAFNRPEHLEKCLRSLSHCDELETVDLHVFIDGPKSPEDITTTEKVRQVASSLEIPARVYVSNSNLGLSKSIISGVSGILATHDQIIVIEDDLVLHKQFLSFILHGLGEFASCEEVASIQGYSPINRLWSKHSYFLRGSDCWGWGTWKNRWQDFQHDPEILLRRLIESNLTKQFDYYGGIPHTQILQNNVLRKNDSWAIRWHGTNFLENKVSLYPPFSLVKNCGDDGSGTNMSKRNRYFLNNTPFNRKLSLAEYPNSIKHNHWLFNYISISLLIKAFPSRIRNLFTFSIFRLKSRFTED